MRKSPYKHKVKRHTRMGRSVSSYQRGRGDKPHRPRRRRVVGRRANRSISSKSPKSYNVTIYYVGKDERLQVDAPNFGKAVTSGLQRRGKTDVPIKMTIRGIL